MEPVLAAGVLAAGVLAAGVLAAGVLAAGVLAAGVLAPGVLAPGVLAAGVLFAACASEVDNAGFFGGKNLLMLPYDACIFCCPSASSLLFLRW